MLREIKNRMDRISVSVCVGAVWELCVSFYCVCVCVCGCVSVCVYVFHQKKKSKDKKIDKKDENEA